MPLVNLYRYQKQWIKTLSEHTKLSQAKLLRILVCQYLLITDGIKGEELQETLSKLNVVPREKLNELNLVKEELRKKRKDQKQRISPFLENYGKPLFSPNESFSGIVRHLIEIDMLDLDTFIKERQLQLDKELRLLKEEHQLLNLKLKYLVENNELRENKIHQTMVENNQGA